MAQKADLQDWLVEALRAKGGSAPLLEVCRHVWNEHERDLRNSGSLFFTWQYDIRWAATVLRKRGTLKEASASPSGVWELARSR